MNPTQNPHLTALKRIIAVRHGDYDKNTKSLTPRGQTQIEALAEHLLQVLPADASVLLLSSPEQRAVESAELIGKKLRVGPQVCEDLALDQWSDAESIYPAVERYLAGGDTLITIGHYTATGGLVTAFCRRLGIQGSARGEPFKGNGFMLDVATQTIANDLFRVAPHPAWATK